MILSFSYFDLDFDCDLELVLILQAIRVANAGVLSWCFCNTGVSFEFEVSLRLVLSSETYIDLCLLHASLRFLSGEAILRGLGILDAGSHGILEAV